MARNYGSNKRSGRRTAKRGSRRSGGGGSGSTMKFNRVGARNVAGRSFNRTGRGGAGRPGPGNVGSATVPGSIARTLANVTPDGLATGGRLVTSDTWRRTAIIYNKMMDSPGFGPNRFGYVDFLGHFTPGQLKHNGALGSQNQEH